MTVSSLNIGYVYGFDSYPCKSGGAIHVHNLITQLSRLGCTIHTFAPESNPACQRYSQDEKGIEAFLEAIDLLYVRIDGWYLSKTPLKITCMQRVAPKPMVWEINSSAEELVFLHHQRTAAMRPRGLVENVKAMRKTLKIKADVRHDERVRRQYAGGVSAACCVSQALKTYAQEALKVSDSRVIPNGSDPDAFSPMHIDKSLFADHADRFKVVYAGDSRWPWQGFNTIVELAEYTRHKDDHVVFFVLDNSPEPIKLGLENVVIVKQVPYDRMPCYLAGADLCLCIYGDFSWSGLGFHLSPLKLFDYLASGKPVVGSHMGQIAEIIDDNKDGLLTSNEVDDLYRKIAMVKADGRLADRLGENARQKILNERSWSHTAQATLAVFQDVMG